MLGIATPDLLVMLLVFGATVLSVMAVAPIFARRVDLRQRLSAAPQVAELPPKPAETLRTDQDRSPWSRLVMAIEARGLSLGDTKAHAVSARLELAGFSQPYALRVFVLARIVLTLGLPALVLIAMLVGGQEMSPVKTYFWLTAVAALGLYAPNFYVSSRAGACKQAILNGFPDTLDLLLVCVEAGLGIDACFNRVGSEITESHPLLAELFASVALELRAGRSREDALRNLSRRSAVTEIGAFVTLIIQSDKLGSSISQALKIYAIEMREGRRMRAEEKAHRLPVLLSVPLVAFMLPTMVGVLMLPAVITMKTSMAPAAAAP